MEIEIYDSHLKYLNDNIIPQTVLHSNSRYAVKNYKAMAAGYMAKEGSIYKVRVQKLFKLCSYGWEY